jgi:Flp pilus assembly protein TadG
MVHRVLNRLRRQDDGAVAIVVALLTSIVFIGLCALVVNLGMARDTRRQAQNAADASALAAGNALYLSGTANTTAAISAAQNYALTNYQVPLTAWATCTDASALASTPDTPDTCISFNSSLTTVRVTVPVRQVPTPFAGIWGVPSVPVGAYAQIQLVAGGPAQCGLCVLGSGADLKSNGNITVTGANVAINGTTSVGPNGGITVSSGFTTALQTLSDKKGSTYSPTAPLTGQATIFDPLINIPLPDYTSLLPAPTTKRTNTCPGAPGIYDHLIACSSMTAGLYVLTGDTGGNFDITGNGVTLYLTCSTSYAPRACTNIGGAGESGGSLSFGGNGSLNITAPTAGQANQGLSIVSDRNNTSTLSFGGNGTQTNSGTIYAARGNMSYNGNGASGSINSLVVVGSLTLIGNNSGFVSTYTQSANVLIPSSGLHLSQ